MWMKSMIFFAFLMACLFTADKSAAEVQVSLGDLVRNPVPIGDANLAGNQESQGVLDVAGNLVPSVVDGVPNLAGNLLSGGLPNVAGNPVSSVGDGVPNLAGNLLSGGLPNVVGNPVSSVLDGVPNLAGNLQSVGVPNLSGTLLSVGVPNLVDNGVKAVNQDPTVQILADCISINLQNSQVLAPYNRFALDNPSDLIFRAGTNFLTRAGVCDPQLAQLDADVAKRTGVLTSKRFFDAIGYTEANFLASQGLVTLASVDYQCLQIVSSIEMVACADGLTDTLSVMNSVVFGVFNVLEQYGLTDYQSMYSQFQLFAAGLISL